MTNNSRVRLGPRDHKILQFVGEQRMSWLDPLHHKFYRGKHLDAARSTLRRLSGSPPRYRYVRPVPLDGQRVCYYLTRKGARLLGFSAHVAIPLGRTAMIRRYAIQWFIEIDGHEKRWLYHPRDYPDLFPIEAHRLPRANFYIEKRNEGTEMGFAVEDYGSDARRIARRATDMLERFLEHGWFDDLIAAERFGVAFLTVSAGKAEALERQFQRSCQRRLALPLARLGAERMARLAAEYLVVPGLIDLIPSERGNRS